MKKIALLAAFAATTMLASPVIAGNAKHSDSKAQMHSSKKMYHSKMKQSRAMRSDRQAVNAQRGSDWDAGWDQRADSGGNRGTNTGFFPLDVATGVTAGAIGTAGAIAGGAVGTVGAIAAAPFEPFRDDWSRGGRDSFASYNEPYVVSKINGPTCEPGTWTTINGARLRCQ